LKILLLDIETTPHNGYFWGLFNQNIAISQIKTPTTILCWAAKWLGKKQMIFRDWSEKDFLSLIYDMVDKADAIVHYNGKSFDMKHLNREWILAKLDPPSPYKDIDLLSTMRKNFKFASNKLEWTSIQMGYKGKVQNRGMQLWLSCMDGDVSAWREMKKYNIQDVRLLEDMYDALLPWIKNHPNWGLYVDGDEDRICTNCGTSRVKKNGIERTRVRTYQRYKCLECGTPLRGRKQLYKTSEGVLT